MSRPKEKIQRTNAISMTSKQGSFNSYPGAHEDGTHQWIITKRAVIYIEQRWPPRFQSELPDFLLNVANPHTTYSFSSVTSPKGMDSQFWFHYLWIGMGMKQLLLNERDCLAKSGYLSQKLPLHEISDLNQLHQEQQKGENKQCGLQNPTQQENVGVREGNRNERV